ncbi:MAG TPA: hypothetical protein VFV79_08905 [Saprospiraceae bacterium]|nr:hypothetical protein [Saprospiraceae bacterium]
MFNSPIFDVTIGLVLIFLLYSLLATTINEGIATIFALRGRMLRNAIRDHMLSNASNDDRWTSVRKGFNEFFSETKALVKTKSKGNEKLGDQFFDHPLMKNYRATQIYPIPSYIPKENFSTILVDLLRKEFEKHVDEIATYKSNEPDATEPKEVLAQQLWLSSDLEKTNELIKYYGRYINQYKTTPPHSLLEVDTWRILQLHLKESGYHWESFLRRIETWFDDTMNRVSGWYKRQAQTILFFLGLAIALILNVDSIQIANRLSTDGEARERLTQLAKQSLDTYKDDPRIKNSVDTFNPNAAAEMAFVVYKHKLDSLVRQSQADMESANNVLALGWENKYDDSKSKITFYSAAKRVFGFLLTAVAICLGAPFWFDLLNKLVKLRGTGKKENGDASELPGKAKAVAMAPVIIRNNNATGEEAVG